MSTDKTLSLQSPLSSTSAARESVGIDQVSWRPADILVGVAALIPLLYLSRFYSEWFSWLPDGVRYMLIAAVPLAWMTLYPQVIARSRNRPIRGGLPDLRFAAKEALIALPIAVITTAALMGTSFLYQRVTGESLGTSGELVRGVPPGELLSFLLMSFTLIPVAEEVFFRGFLYNAANQNCTRGALLLQALLFAIAHPYSLPQRVVIFATGLMLGAVYRWRKSLVAPILIHSTHNFVMSVLIVALITASAKAPYLGLFGKLSEEGHQIREVAPNSPASEAGLLPGDIIVRIDQSLVKPNNELSRILRAKKAGQLLEIEVLRDGRSMVRKIRAIQRPQATGRE